jgi:serine protease Do
MKTKSIITIAVIMVLSVTGFAQNPPTPPVPPSPPNTPGGPKPPPNRREKLPKVPVTFLGVDTSDVPKVVSEQLGLTKGFGLVVDYVVPESPAAAAGVQQNDIIKMLNDQILTEPDQLAKLVRSYSEGTNVTLTLLRKGQEQKVTVKLTKKEVPQRDAFGPRPRRHRDFNFDHDFSSLDLDDVINMDDLKDELEDLKEELGDSQKGMIHDVVMKAREDMKHAGDEIRRAAGQLKIYSNDDDALKTTKIDMGKAQIVFSDDKGELRIEKIDGKKVLTAKDPKGLLLFSGPVESKEDLEKVPAEVRQRYDKLQKNDLPAVVSSPGNDEDSDEDAADEADNDDDEDPHSFPDEVSAILLPRSIWPLHPVLI